MSTRGYAVHEAGSPLAPWEFDRRDPRPRDVEVRIRFCGVCHSDIHQARDEWGDAIFPMVPGHEIIGTVTRTGAEVERFALGDVVGVGVFVDSCRVCDACRAGEEQYCERGMSATYNGYEQDGTTPTYGGYSERIVVDEAYVLQIPQPLDLARAAPLLCAGITTYSPIRHFGVRNGDRAAVAGLGGLGHLGLKFLKAIGAEATVLSHSLSKRADALAMGADEFIVLDNGETFTQHQRRFDFILDTVSAKHDYNDYLKLLRRDGTMALVGLPEPSVLDAASVTSRRRRLTGSIIGGIRETQEMLDFCAERGIAAEVEMIAMRDINDAFERTIRSDVRYRFVIDMQTLTESAQ